MGQAILRSSRSWNDLRIVAAIEHDACPVVGRDAGVVAGLPELGVTITTGLKQAVEAADVLIDFSAHTVVPETAQLAAARHTPLVIGTTGLTEPERHIVQQAARQIPVVMAPNMSVGVNLLFALVEKAAATLGLDYDVEIVEMHHRFKKDAPSGTALQFGEKVAAGRKQSLKANLICGREGLTGERPRGQIGMHALRGGDVVGDHTVTFAIEGERIEFTHKASSRDALARGALRAAVWLVGRKPGLYDMQTVLGL
jgi:4-hydroxy-tetrahydrodipicolinate reductase